MSPLSRPHISTPDITGPVTPHIKASLVLSYDFLRLYVNAFAFQATLNRAVAKSMRSQDPAARSRNNASALFKDLAGNPDARFIYESIDAANSLLGTFNGFIDPVAGLKYMPLKYYLYVIYAAVFLFKVGFPPSPSGFCCTQHVVRVLT